MFLGSFGTIGDWPNQSWLAWFDTTPSCKDFEWSSSSKANSHVMRAVLGGWSKLVKLMSGWVRFRWLVCTHVISCVLVRTCMYLSWFRWDEGPVTCHLLCQTCKPRHFRAPFGSRVVLSCTSWSKRTYCRHSCNQHRGHFTIKKQYAENEAKYCKPSDRPYEREVCEPVAEHQTSPVFMKQRQFFPCHCHQIV